MNVLSHFFKKKKPPQNRKLVQKWERVYPLICWFSVYKEEMGP